MIERPHEVVYGEVETPTCGPGDVLVRSRFAGLCRTDVEVLEGELDLRWVRYPCIPGHEWSGVVEAVGEGVTGLEPGRPRRLRGVLLLRRLPPLPGRRYPPLRDL